MTLVVNPDASRDATGTRARAVAAASTPPARGKEPWYRHPDAVAPGIATLVVIVGYAVSIAIWESVHAAPIRVASDTSAFALLYIAAQATERLLEPFASFVMESRTARGEMEVAMAAAMNAPDDPARWQAAADARDRLDRRQRARAYIMWSAATVLGMLASATIGIYLIAAIADRRPSVPIDILVTGLVIGGGTKPLHDLISRIESAKQRAQDPVANA